MIKLNVQASLETLSNHPESFINLYRHGSLDVELYKPEGQDGQKPRTRDEIYVIATGSGVFQCGKEKDFVERGDVLFVAAGVKHSFLNFTQDFSTWVFFYGPEGGEQF